MKVALVHDYLNEFGGAERVLDALSEIWPDAPIYTAFYKEGSNAYEKFKNRKIIPSWAHYIPGFASRFHSPLRFLAPWIWGSFKEEFKQYDVVISSASWYVTKGFGSRHSGEHSDSRIDSGQARMTKKRGPVEICYCHTPPRWLYGYQTSINWQKYWLVRVYAAIVGHFMRMYNFNAAQRVNYFIANSKEVQARIQKFYRRDSVVIYPPVHLASSKLAPSVQLKNKKLDADSPDARRSSYYFMVARLSGPKGIEMAVEAAVKGNFKLKIAGAPSGHYTKHETLQKRAAKNVEFLGYVEDSELVELFRNAKGFLALSQDEDFGITPVEAMSCGTAVIAFYGGGYKETIVDPSVNSGQGATGVFFHEPTVESLLSAIKTFEKTKFKRKDLIEHAQKFSKERFKRQILNFVEAAWQKQGQKDA